MVWGGCLWHPASARAATAVVAIVKRARRVIVLLLENISSTACFVRGRNHEKEFGWP